MNGGLKLTLPPEKTTKIVKNVSFKGLRQLGIKKAFPETTTYKILEKSFCFHVKQCTTG